MRFFSRRGRSRSVDRAGRAKRESRQRHHDAYLPHKHDKKHNKREDASVGSDLPTLDQFEIAVPSKSFASNSFGASDPPLESREDQEDDDRSRSDISSITSVSYRAGYYYLRSIKNKKEATAKSSGCLPSCSCAACMPCSCSWLTCCCCREAKSELAAAASGMEATATTTTNSILDHPPPHHPSVRAKARKAQNAGRRAICPDGQPKRGRKSSGRRHKIVEEVASPVPEIKRDHSLFDELSEEEEMRAGYGGHRRQAPPSSQYHHKMQHNQRRNKSKTWLSRRQGHHASGPEYIAATTTIPIREKATTSRGRARQRGRRGEWY